MNALASECSSGCESGWTLYLDHSFLNQNASHGGTQSQFMSETDGFYEEHKDKRAKEEEYGEEDSSMVSDASSGPPHFIDAEAYFNEEQNGGFYSASKTKAVKLAKSGTKKEKVKENQHLKDQQHLPSFLHDTASSCVFDFSANEVAMNNRQISTESQSVLDYSQGFSANYFKGKSSFHQHVGFLQSSLSENELQGNKWYGEKMGMR